MKRHFVQVARLAIGSYTPFLEPFWGAEERSLIREWDGGADFAGGELELEEFLRSQLGSGWTVKVLNSGRSAIQATLEALSLPSHSEVLVPSFACMAVAQAVLQARLQPVFVDIDDQFNMSFASVLEAAGPRVRALILPHLSGCWARDAEQILGWARARDVFVLEDVAQASGLRKDGQLAGTFGDAGVFSTGLGKTLFGPGGGWVITRHGIAKRLGEMQIDREPEALVRSRIGRFVRDYLSSTAKRGRTTLGHAVRHKLDAARRHGLRTECADPGFSVHAMSGIEARLAIDQLVKLDLIVERQRAAATAWRERLLPQRLAGITLLPHADNTHAKMLVSFEADDEAVRVKRVLSLHGVECEASYTPLHLRPPFRQIRRVSLANTERRWRGVFTLPTRPNLAARDWARIDRAIAQL